MSACLRACVRANFEAKTCKGWVISCPLVFRLLVICGLFIHACMCLGRARTQCVPMIATHGEYVCVCTRAHAFRMQPRTFFAHAKAHTHHDIHQSHSSAGASGRGTHAWDRDITSPSASLRSPSPSATHACKSKASGPTTYHRGRGEHQPPLLSGSCCCTKATGRMDPEARGR